MATTNREGPGSLLTPCWRETDSLHQCRSEKNGLGEPAHGQHVPFSGLVQTHTPGETSTFSFAAAEFTRETDSPAEGTGFEPSVPLLRKALLGVANRRRRHERRSHLQVQVRNGNACLEWLPTAFPFAEGPRVRVILPPAVSPANFDVARAGDGYPQIGRGTSTVEIPGGRSRCCYSGSRLHSSVSTYPIFVTHWGRLTASPL